MQDFERLQALLLKIRKEFCRDNATEMARRIGKDASYVHRLFYPRDKKGAKGIGLEIMQACTETFSLPPGYWESEPVQRTYTVQEDIATYRISTSPLDEWTTAAVAIMQSLSGVQKAQMVAKMREYKQFLGPPRDGQTLQVAG